MREADLMWSRRRFLLSTVKATGVTAAGLVVGPEVFDYLDRIGPRRLLINGQDATLTNLLPKLLSQGLWALRENAVMPRLVRPRALYDVRTGAEIRI